MRRGRWIAAAAGCVALAGGAVWLCLPDPAPALVARARVYQVFDACLLTGPAGISAPAAAPVWAGMQQASEQTRVKVSFLAVAGPETVENVVPYVNSLIARHCDLLVGVGAQETAAVSAQAASHPDLHFAVIAAQAAGTNVAVVPATDASGTSNAVQKLIVDAFHGQFTGGRA